MKTNALRSIYFLCRLLFLSLLVGLLMISCKVVQPFQVTEVAPENLFREVQGKDTLSIGTLPWKQVFTDPILQSMVEEGLSKNSDLQLAVLKIDEAMASFKQSRLGWLPSLNGEGQATFVQKGAGASWNKTYEAYLGSSWEIDFWGKLRSAKRAQLMLLKQSQAYQKAVQTELIASIATYYFDLLVLDQQLKISEQSLEIRKADVESMKALKESNVVTGAAVVQSEANRYSVEVTLPELRKSIRETENALSILLGRVPGTVTRGDLDAQKVEVDLKAGLPAMLLANRPDVQEAEYQLRYYAELKNVARTAFYPAITLTAQAGYANGDFTNLISAPSFFANILGGLTQPVFNQGLNRQKLKLAQAHQQEALVSFRQSLLNAGKEVSDALFACQVAGEKIEIRKQQIAFLEKSVDYTKELLKYTSATNYTDVLTSEQGLLSAQLSSISDKQARLYAIVNLYRSLGGGVN